MDAVPAPLLLLVGALVGAGACWLLLSLRFRAAAADAAGPPPTRRSRSAPTPPPSGPNAPVCSSGSTSWSPSTTRRAQQLRRAEADAAAAERRAAEPSARPRPAGSSCSPRRDAELKQAFRALSAEALARNNEQFVALAEGRIKEATAALAGDDSGARHRRSAHCSTRCRRRCSASRASCATSRRSARAPTSGSVSRSTRCAANSEQLRTETKQLVNALRAPQVRGRWGELQLERVVQLAGMVEHCDFSTQVTRTGHRRRAGVRPDMVVHLAGGKSVVVDAKVPFAAYLEAVESRDTPTARRPAYRARPAAACACRHAGGQGVLGGVRAVAGVRGAVRPGRPVPRGGAAGRARRCWSTPSAATSSSRPPPR